MESQNIKEITVSLSADESLRKGVYANIVGIRTTNKEAVLDFGFIDGEEMGKDGKLARIGVVESRVIMTFDTLVEFRDALNAHIESNLVKAER